MAFEFRLPDIGEGLTEAEVVEWLIDLGRPVELDAPLVQIETDKAVTDIPAPRAGVLLHQGAAAGAVIRVGDVLAVIGEPGEEWEERGIAAPKRAESIEPGPAADAEPLPIVGTLPGPEGRIEALPVVRKLARDLGIDLATVVGTGPGGRPTREDVERAAAGTAPGGTRGDDGQRVRLSRLRRTIAERMARSWREIPHVTTFGEADASDLLAVRRSLGERRGRPVAFEALFIQAVLPALRAHPEFNASLEGEELMLKRRYDIGVAVDTPQGLIVAVVKDAGRRDVIELADEVARLGEATRSRTATAAELTGATFTISNIGAVGGGYGTPIIPFGTTAILSFGRIEERPVARDGRIGVAPLLPLSLSYDHRVIDGALGRRFLSAVVRDLESPPGPASLQRS